MRHTSGTRYELVLESSEGAERAIYRASVHAPPAEPRAAIVEITPAGATIVAGGEGLEPALAAQLVALARTLGKRADEGPWPRRITRWRKPGVR